MFAGLADRDPTANDSWKRLNGVWRWTNEVLTTVFPEMWQCQRLI